MAGRAEGGGAATLVLRLAAGMCSRSYGKRRLVRKLCCVFSGKEGARGRGPAGRAGGGKGLPTVWPPDADCSDLPRSGGALRVSVCFVPAHAGRFRPGVAGPSCQGKGWQAQGSVVPGTGVILPLLRHNVFSMYYPAFVCGRKPLRFMLFLFAEE